MGARPLAVRLSGEPPPAWQGAIATLFRVTAGILLVYPLKSIAPVVSLGVVFIPGVLLIATVWGWRLGLLTSFLVSEVETHFAHQPLHFVVSRPGAEPTNRSKAWKRSCEGCAFGADRSSEPRDELLALRRRLRRARGMLGDAGSCRRGERGTDHDHRVQRRPRPRDRELGAQRARGGRPSRSSQGANRSTDSDRWISTPS